MCTAITIRTSQGNTCFGRTMDFSYPLDPELYISPRGYEWNNLAATHRIRSRYSFIGAAQDLRTSLSIRGKHWKPVNA